MTCSSQGARVEINLENVLWRTRGRLWDYTFVLHPLYPSAVNWYDVHSKVFAGLTPAAVPVSRGGVVVDGEEEHPFVATAFLDPVHRDAAGRPVAHYLIWFLQFNQPFGSSLNLPNNWGQQLTISLLDTRAQIFDAGSGDEAENVFAGTRAIEQPIEFDGACAPVLIELRVADEKKKSKSLPKPSSKWATLMGPVAAIFIILTLCWYLTR